MQHYCTLFCTSSISYGRHATTIDFYVVRFLLRLPTDLTLRCKMSLALAYVLDATLLRCFLRLPTDLMLRCKMCFALAYQQGHRSVSVRHVLQEFTRKLKRKPWRASKIAGTIGTQKADSSWKRIKKWFPDNLVNTGCLCRQINPQLLKYVRSWQWRSQEKINCVSHLCKALKAMYAR